MIRANMYLYLHDGQKNPCSNWVIVLHVIASIWTCMYVHVRTCTYIRANK